MFLIDARLPEVYFIHSLAVVLPAFVSVRVKEPSKTNLVTSRHILIFLKKDKASLPVDVCRSKTSLLKLPIKSSRQHTVGHAQGIK